MADDEDRLLIDATEVPIARSTISWVQNITYSGYKKRHTLKYEVALSEKTGEPVSYSGPFVGCTGDITIFRTFLKQKMLDFGLQGLADGTYQGESDLLDVPPRPYSADTAEQRANRKVQSRRRVPVENFFSRMKHFKVLKHTYRHALCDHHEVFFVILSIVKMDLLQKPLRKQE